MKSSYVLGKNARSQNFSYIYNKGVGKSIAASKLRTKRILSEAEIPIPEIYARFTRPQSILKFDWETLPSSFALKPNKGLGGEGIVIAKKRATDGDGWVTTARKRVRVDDLKLHILDILEGAFSLRNAPDYAFIEEFVGRHKAFRKIAYRGTPDIRVVVFNKVPIMAMMRLPTKESGGRANLHQGAIAVGIDIATGITTKAYWKGEYIKYKPDYQSNLPYKLHLKGTSKKSHSPSRRLSRVGDRPRGKKRKLHGIRIPDWTKILKLAVKCQEVTNLGYVGVDIVLHPEKGPMVLELNYQPGLQIQLANTAGLRKRLERVEDLTVRDAEHGVKIAKALFSASFADRVKASEGIRTISAIEEIKIRGRDKKKVVVSAKIDTGAWRTSISEKLAKELGLLEKGNVLWTKRVISSLGAQRRKVINLTFWLAGRKITTPASVAKRMTLKYQVIIGRKNLKGLLVDPHLTIEDKRKSQINK